jgi:cbb3-type cytochrome oxidase cytochrome c subunit
MKNGVTVFLAALLALGLSWCGFVLAPAIQLGTAKQTSVLNSSDVYPVQRTGDATLGLQVYRASGCAQCHTTQVRQDDVVFQIVLMNAGKNPSAVSNLISTLKLSGLNKDEADSAASQITAAGGKVETHLIATGTDIARGWGIRRSVAADFLYDYPVQLGSLRVGPDLANIGVRAPDANWQLQHLYVPQSVVKNSAMPPFRFLFQMRKIGNPAALVANDVNFISLKLPSEFAPPAGYEIVPTDDAKNLVAYLLSLRSDVPLYEAPFTPPQISTNAPNQK